MLFKRGERMKHKKTSKNLLPILFATLVGSLLTGCGSLSQVRIGQNIYTVNENKPCANKNNYSASGTRVKYENLPYSSAYDIALQSVAELNLTYIMQGDIVFKDKNMGVILVNNKFISKKPRSNNPDIFYTSQTILIRKDGNGSIIEIKRPVTGGNVIIIGNADCFFFEIVDRRLNRK